MILTHGTTQYEVERRPVAETAKYRVYICKDRATDRQYLLQIASETKYNGDIDRAAFVLRELKRTSDLIEAEYAKTNPEKKLNYDLLFPGVVDSFISDDQGRRRINILSLKGVAGIRKMIPLSNLANRDRLRINLPTSAWIMGRLLKLLGFTHSQGIAVRALQGNNVLIEPDNHFMVVFDWSSAHTYQQDVPRSARQDDIARAAQAVFAAIGGNPDTADFPYNLEDGRYVKLLERFTRGKESNADKAHANFYELVDEVFGRGFRPFKTLPL